jgi:nicotinamidase-related amidase
MPIAAGQHTALLVIDMQAGLFTSQTPRHDAEGVVSRINSLARTVRESGGTVIFIQHEGPTGDAFERGVPGWELLTSLDREPSDLIVCKSACDSFYASELTSVLEQRGVRRLLVTGCATDFCVDTTVRAAMSRDYEIVVVSDGHTTADRPHVSAVSLIRHHNWLWQDLIHPTLRVEVLPAAAVVARLEVL